MLLLRRAVQARDRRLQRQVVGPPGVDPAEQGVHEAVDDLVAEPGPDERTDGDVLAGGEQRRTGVDIRPGGLGWRRAGLEVLAVGLPAGAVLLGAPGPFGFSVLAGGALADNRRRLADLRRRPAAWVKAA